MARGGDGKGLLALWQEAVRDGEDPLRGLLQHMLQGLLEDRYGPAEADGRARNARIIELPMLDSALHYDNTEDTLTSKPPGDGHA